MGTPLRIDESREMDSATRRTFGKIKGYIDDNYGGAIRGRKNIIHNGGFQVNQKAGPYSGITASGGFVDRWQTVLGAYGTWDVGYLGFGTSYIATGDGEQFKACYYMKNTVAGALGAGSFLIFRQAVEVNCLEPLLKGTPAAKTFTLSFWVYVSKAGTWNLEIEDPINSRRIIQQYTVTAAATWQRVVLTFPGDTVSGYSDANRALAGFYINWWFAGGSNFAGTAITQGWQTFAASATQRGTGMTTFGTAINDEFRVTGVQLEVGSVATDFDFRSYNEELHDCQRYYWAWRPLVNFAIVGPGICTTASNAQIAVPFPVQMRAAPTVTFTNVTNLGISNAGGVLIAATTGAGGVGVTTILMGYLDMTTAGGLVAGNATRMHANGTTNCAIEFIAEI